jgi:hypothetical protein
MTHCRHADVCLLLGFVAIATNVCLKARDPGVRDR